MSRASRGLFDWPLSTGEFVGKLGFIRSVVVGSS